MARRQPKCDICRERLSDLLSIDEELKQEEGRNICTLCIRSRELKRKWELEKTQQQGEIK